MQTMLLSREEVARRARELYKNIIRQQVETHENIGKIAIIDFESGVYKVEETRLKAARKRACKTSTFASLRPSHWI